MLGIRVNSFLHFLPFSSSLLSCSLLVFPSLFSLSPQPSYLSRPAFGFFSPRPFTYRILYPLPSSLLKTRPQASVDSPLSSMRQELQDPCVSWPECLSVPTWQDLEDYGAFVHPSSSFVSAQPLACFQSDRSRFAPESVEPQRHVSVQSSSRFACLSFRDHARFDSVARVCGLCDPVCLLPAFVPSRCPARTCSRPQCSCPQCSRRSPLRLPDALLRCTVSLPMPRKPCPRSFVSFYLLSFL
jgi:hypothetical protein